MIHPLPVAGVECDNNWFWQGKVIERYVPVTPKTSTVSFSNLGNLGNPFGEYESSD